MSLARIHASTYKTLHDITDLKVFFKRLHEIYMEYNTDDNINAPDFYHNVIFDYIVETNNLILSDHPGERSTFYGKALRSYSNLSYIKKMTVVFLVTIHKRNDLQNINDIIEGLKNTYA